MPDILKKTSTANILIIAIVVGLVAYAVYRNKNSATGGNPAETGEAE